MPSYEIRYQVSSARGEHVAGPVSEVVTASNSAEARALIKSRYPNAVVTFLGTRQVG
jgi:hypothetical protein